MSPFVLDRSDPLSGLARGGQIGANADEQEGVGTSGSAGSSAQQATAGRGCQWTAAGELPAGQAAVEAVSGGRSCGAEASQRGAKLESRPRQEVSTASAAASAGKVRRGGGRALWADAGDRTLGGGGRAEDSCRNAAALDASGRVVEPGAKTAAPPLAARRARGFWGEGADGRHASGPAGEETAAPTNQQSRSSERIPEKRISAGAQSPVCTNGGEGGGLPSSRAARGGTGPDFPIGERTHDQQ